MSKMVVWDQISCGSDCTGPYYVRWSKPMTVGEFIDEIITNYQSEWGYIGIYSNDRYATFGDPVCEYSHGQITKPMPDEYLSKQIKEITGSGGWSRSDFLLILED